jgi:phage terminase Nu1 subunit (DNA packaging protein)
MVTPNHYAKHRQVTLQAVLAAIKSGRLVKSVTQKPSGRYLVDVELADKEWAENTDNLTGAAAHVSKRKPEIDTSAEHVADDDTPMTYAEARAKHERFKARLAELELEQREGKLVEADVVQREAFKASRQVRDALLNLPDRVAGLLAAETNQFKVHQLLTKEIRRALEDLKFD